MNIQSPNSISRNAAVINQSDYDAWFNEISESENISDVKLDHVVLSGLTAPQFDWRECCLDTCRLIGAVMRSSYFCDVTFKNCDFSNSVLASCTFNRVEFISCKLTGANIHNSNFSDVMFKDCIADYAIFTDATSRGIAFFGCILKETQLNDIAGKNYSFEECDLSRANFSSTALRGVNLTSCDIQGITVSEHELRGAIVTAPQACELAKLLGVIIV